MLDTFKGLRGLAEGKTARQFDHGLGPRARTLVTVAAGGNEETGVCGGDAGTTSFRFYSFFPVVRVWEPLEVGAVVGCCFLCSWFVLKCLAMQLFGFPMIHIFARATAGDIKCRQARRAGADRQGQAETENVSKRKERPRQRG